MQIVFLIVALLVASTQCLSVCAGPVCHQTSVAGDEGSEAKLPPCHRRLPQKAPVPPSSCKFSVLVAEQQAASFVAPEVAPVAFTAAGGDGAELPAACLRRISYETPPPLSYDSSHFRVLRV